MSREKKLRSLPGGEIRSLRLNRTERGYCVSLESGESGESGKSGESGDGELSLARSSDRGIWSILTPSGRSFEATVERMDGEIHVAVGHQTFRFTSGRSVAGARAGGGLSRVEVKAPMPGKVVRVLVPEGERVTAGQPILLFEAMKMQNELRSPQEGVLSRVLVVPGQAVEARESLYIVDPPPS